MCGGDALGITRFGQPRWGGDERNIPLWSGRKGEDGGEVEGVLVHGFVGDYSSEKLQQTAAAVEDVRLDSLRKKIKEDVRGVRQGEIKVLRPKGGDKNPWCRRNRRDTAAAQRTLGSTRGGLAARFKGEGGANGGGRDALLIGQHMARNNGHNCEKSEGEDHGRVELAGAKIQEEGMTSRSRHQVGSTGQRERRKRKKKRARAACWAAAGDRVGPRLGWLWLARP